MWVWVGFNSGVSISCTYTHYMDLWNIRDVGYNTTKRQPEKKYMFDLLWVVVSHQKKKRKRLSAVLSIFSRSVFTSCHSPNGQYLPLVHILFSTPSTHQGADIRHLSKHFHHYYVFTTRPLRIGAPCLPSCVYFYRHVSPCHSHTLRLTGICHLCVSCFVTGGSWRLFAFN